MNNSGDVPMFHGAPKHIFAKARILRKSMTPAEEKVWNLLKGRKLKNLKFRRQHPIGNFIVDFFCLEIELVIEIDGKIHQDVHQKSYDEERSWNLNAMGYMVIRFTNHQVFYEFDWVCDELAKIIEKKMSCHKTS